MGFAGVWGSRSRALWADIRALGWMPRKRPPIETGWLHTTRGARLVRAHRWVMGLGAALLATAVTFGPSVSVEAVADGPHGAEADALRGWLVQRLIEEGYTIAPADQADRVLTLRADDDAVAVGNGAESFEIDLGPAAVMRLEALHRARLLLEHAPPTGPADAERSVLGLRSASEAPEGDAGALESALLRAGYVLTPRPRDDDPVLCVTHDAGQLGASVTDGAETCPDPQVFVSYAELRGANGVDTIVALLEAHATQPPQDPGPPPEVASEPEPATTPPPSTPAEPARRRFISDGAEFRMGADVGLVARGNVDAYGRAQMRVGKLQGPGAQLHVGVIPSRNGTARAVDTTLAAGPDLRLGRRRFGAEFALVAGALVHAYVDESGRGGAANWYVGLPASVSFGRAPDRLRLHLFTEAFITGGRLQHIRDNAPNWARSAWGVRAGFGFTWGWNIR